MTVNYNVTGAKRKELVQLIAHFMGSEVKYKGAPTFAYEVDYFTIDKSGVLSFPDKTDSEMLDRLMAMLYHNSFVPESLPEQEAEEEKVGITIKIPLEGFTGNAMVNINAIIEAKGKLIKKALGIDDLEIFLGPDAVEFPWLSTDSNAEEIAIYTHFITSLCDFAKKQKKITAKDKDVENEKYAFRCFLLRLGFIGSEYKNERKILLRNFEGSSAFKSGTRNETEVD